MDGTTRDLVAFLSAAYVEGGFLVVALVLARRLISGVNPGAGLLGVTAAGLWRWRCRRRWRRQYRFCA